MGVNGVLFKDSFMEIKMFFIPHLLHITLITIVSTVFAHDREHQGPQTCGGRLKGPVGTIQTPNFPEAFPVPIKCKWIIEHDIVNGTISIYFTQQYTTSGLTFTEYTYYDDTYKLEERRALTVTEENITKIKWLQVQSPVLVVELSLNRLEGTQLRALGLLSVFGFNITYAVKKSTDVSDPSSCSAIECRLLGHCYANHDYQRFFCSCFEGYSGVDCGVGPLCVRNMCKNGGTCRQMGPAAVSCICAEGYTGDLCDSHIAQPQCGIEECSSRCRKGSFCDCNPKDVDSTLARFDTKLQVMDQPNDNISKEIVKELTSYLISSNLSLEGEIEILNISAADASGYRSVFIRVWASRGVAGALRSAFAQLSARRARTSLRLMADALHFVMHPALSLQVLAVNKRPEVWEGSEFILTCMAHGSPDTSFTWYKDGVKVNFNGTTREIWTRSVSEDALGRRMSVLGVSSARQIDEGVWSCAADDVIRRCRDITLTVLTPPAVRLVPNAITVAKGENVSITCLAGAGRAHGVLGFSWAREKSLLPMQPDKHMWEDLYPAGSVLKLYNVQKSNEYSCQVSSMAGTNSAAVTVWALGVDDEACPIDVAYGMRWTRTAPGAHDSSSCPTGYSGETSRFCQPKAGQHGVKWMTPDFGGCVADSLKDIYEQFTLIFHGYSWRNVSDVSQQYLSVLRSLPTLHGAGVFPLRHATHMLQYLLSGVAQRKDRLNSVTHLLNMYDLLLTQPDSFLDEQKIFELQKAISDTAGLSGRASVDLHSFSVTSEPVARDNTAHLEMQYAIAGTDDWLLTSVELLVSSKNRLNATLVAILYHYLGDRLPSLRRIIKHNAGREIQYAVCSQQVQVAVSDAKLEPSLLSTVSLVFKHSHNFSADASLLTCAIRSSESPGVWSVSLCDVRMLRTSHVTCHCSGTGTIALLRQTTHIKIDAEMELRGVVVISLHVCGAMCACACILQLLALAPAATRRQDALPKMLRAGTAAGHATAVLLLLQCDTQHTACAGTLGWVVAACCCAACAALCAMPLLLHAELAGRRERPSSVAALAGVCVLCCLSARMWGGSPLQVGSAAGNTFVGGITLITVLALVLALCARRMLRQITHKLPPDRRSYVKKKNVVVQNTLVLLLTSSVAQVLGVMYAQPGDERVVLIIALSGAALAHGVAIVVCYVIRDEDCLCAVRNILTMHTGPEWRDSPAGGDTSLNLYIQQSGEVESRGGVVTLESWSSPVSPAAKYWRATPIERRRSNPDNRADIVRCVEYRSSMCEAAPYDTHTHAVCDLIPTSAGRLDGEYAAKVCLEVSAKHERVPVLACREAIVDATVETDKAMCTICAKSTPDVSLLTSPPIKSCLKKCPRGFTSSTSLPSIDTIKDDCNKSHIEHVNREWNKAYDNTQTDKVLNKISNDLNFLLNRTLSESPHKLDQSAT